MKAIMILILITYSGLCSQDSTQVEDNTGTLIVHFTDIPGDEGVLRVALSESQEQYESDEIAFRTASAQIKEGYATVRFDDIPYGDYAVKVYHDEDEDSELDTNFFGAPSEAYGFSNNARGSFGPAAWDDAKFIFKSSLDTLYIIVE